ncbi:MAG: DUF4878 domain-containing protein [Prevotella sp.]|nr:DUF4878 domain-containing protein [Prevotella sp.]
MRKVLFAALVCAMAVVMTSCGSSSSPRGVAEKALDCAINEDYRGYMDCVYFPEDQKEQKEAYISMIEEKAKKAKENGSANDKKPVSYKFVSEEIDEEAGRAKETFEVTYSDDSTKEESMDLTKEKDGKWYLQLKK